MEHKYAAIYDMLNYLPDIQEIIEKHYWALEDHDNKEIWRRQNKHNQDLMIIEWNLFIECELDLGEGLHGEDCNTKEAAASNIIHYIVTSGDKISPIGYELPIEYTKTINNLPSDYRRRIVMELEEENRLHCKY